jgi:hypothetical protein
MNIDKIQLFVIKTFSRVHITNLKSSYHGDHKINYLKAKFSSFYATVPEFLDKLESRFRFLEETENTDHLNKKKDKLSPAGIVPKESFFLF